MITKQELEINMDGTVTTRTENIQTVGNWFWEVMEEKPMRPPFPDVEKIIFQPPYTIVLWDDHTRTIVKCGKDDKFDEDAGFAIAVARKLYGGRKNFQRLVESADHQEVEHKAKKNLKK